MNRLARWVMLLYPSCWRRRYAEEFGALIEDTGANARVVADLLKGAILMRFSTWSFPRLAAILGLAGMLIGLALSMSGSSGYIARAELTLTDSDFPALTIAISIEDLEFIAKVSGRREFQDAQKLVPFQPLDESGGKLFVGTTEIMED